jgi:flavodoxin/NAD-dependent dihydropyrimidine dehydrogenase PreA subunit
MIMKTLIICFSQTGNTLKVAECIQDGIQEVTDSCELKKLEEVNKDELSNYDLVGLGCPVFYFREPFHVSDFIEGLPDLKGKQWFVFCSHGSVLGLTLISLAERLEEKGILVIGSHHTYADGTLPFYPYPTVTTGHPDDKDLEEARVFGKSIAQCSLAVAKGDTGCIVKPAPVTEDWVPQEAAMLTREFMDQAMPRLSIDDDKCTMCGECQDVCPVQGIDIEAEPRRIQDPCIYCWYCAKLCPTCAIETDWSMLVSMAPANYERYIQALKDAEARGEFRWLVDPDTMNYDDPLFKQKLREVEEEE